jgi:mannose-6-phosphate isomerase-like protein (cupin superfamily)
MAYSKNWRDCQPKIAHLSAVHWGGLRLAEEGSDDERDRLIRLNGFARHALQGRKTSDNHKHENLEQVYYILDGKGEALYDGKRYPVEAGDAIYLPSGVHHQMFNDNDEWLVHHVISMGVEGNGGQFMQRNWRQVQPQADGGGAIRWTQLAPEGQGDNGCLRGMAFIARETVQPRGCTTEQSSADLEQVYYVLAGRGQLETDGNTQTVCEGDMIHLPAGVTYRFTNPNENWLAYLIMAA